MEIRQIEYFLAIVEHGGTAAAARALDIGQPSLSQTVRTLERELGSPLFDRQSRVLTLTAAGRALIEPCSRIMRNVATWTDVVTADPSEVCGRLTIAVFPALADIMVDVVADFCARYPRVTTRIIDLLRDDHPRATDIVRHGDVDLAALHLPALDKSLTVLHLGEQEHVAVYPPEFDLPAGPVDITRLPDVPMVFVPEVHAITRVVGRQMRSRGYKPRVSTVAEHREMLGPLVSAGVGGAIVDRRMAESLATVVDIRPIQPRVAPPYGLVYDEARLSAAAEAFLDIAREHAVGPTSI